MSLGKDPCGAKEKKYTNQTVILISFDQHSVNTAYVLFRDKLLWWMILFLHINWTVISGTV